MSSRSSLNFLCKCNILSCRRAAAPATQTVTEDIASPVSSCVLLLERVKGNNSDADRQSSRDGEEEGHGNTGFGSVGDCQQENTMGAEREGH